LRELEETGGKKNEVILMGDMKMDVLCGASREPDGYVREDSVQ
jgi:hypothetical protein